ncbi:TPA: hypothetical protein N0F65_005086 [Lagenidium giganteum]|uniref:Glutathione S-transferase n=1 Tax=Lagenidium giganteum TaxID=4803 RepID=A0AAV2YCU5_9STRA|nr:TPA: hypothetical protein N0F65_005086 [Lagenidium giganteum]
MFYREERTRCTQLSLRRCHARYMHYCQSSFPNFLTSSYTSSLSAKEIMSPSIKLSYFGIPGRGELPRLAFSYGNVPFEDTRLTGEQFGALKPSLPLGQMPVIDVDGKMYAQSLAIARYAAKLSGAYPSEAVKALKVDMVIETLVDVTNAEIDIFHLERNADAKAAKTKKLLEETLPKILAALEKVVEGKFFTGDAITLADISVYDRFENGIKPNFAQFDFSPYPKLVAIAAGVKAHPNIAAYLAKHQH